jgi:hypothetical protein
MRSFSLISTNWKENMIQCGCVKKRFNLCEICTIWKCLKDLILKVEKFSVHAHCQGAQNDAKKT